MTIKCEVVRELLPVLMEGTLDLETTQQVRQHVAHCSDCAELERAESFGRIVIGAICVEQALQEAKQELAEAELGRSPAPTTFRGVRSIFKYARTAAAIAVGATLTASIILRFRPQDSVSSTDGPLLASALADKWPLPFDLWPPLASSDEVNDAIHRIEQQDDVLAKARAAIISGEFSEADEHLAKAAAQYFTVQGDRFYVEHKYDEAIAPYEKAFDLAPEDVVIRNNLAIALNLDRSGSVESNQYRAIELLEEVLPRLEPGTREWLKTNNNLANAWIRLADRNCLDCAAKASTHYTAALDALAREEWPFGWAILQSNLGKAWALSGDKKRAVACFEAALQEITRDKLFYWAGILGNLGFARIELGQIEEGIRIYEEVLDAFTFEDDPESWAFTEVNLGEAWRLLESGDRAENLRKAREHSTSALRWYRRETAPRMWALATENLGRSYGRGAYGDEHQNFQLLTTHLQAALEVLKREDYTRDYGRIHRALANAWAAKTDGSTEENVLKAIEHYKLALEAYTPEDYPLEHAEILSELEQVERELAELDQAQQLP